MKNLFYCGLLLLVPGCATERTVTTPPPEPSASALAAPRHLTKAELTRIATGLAKQEGYQLAQFQEPRFEWDPREQLWTVWFLRKPPIVAGGYFTVRVHDNTGDAYFLHKE
jgi:hypothetical protein